MDCDEYTLLEFINFKPITANLLEKLSVVKDKKLMIGIMDLVKERYKKNIPKKCYTKAIKYLYSCIEEIDEKEIDMFEKEYQKRIASTKLNQLIREKTLYFAKSVKKCGTCEDVSVYHKKCECCNIAFCSVECQLSSH